jgi:uncharacterized protein YjlB
MMVLITPETYYLKPTRFVPNSILPVLLYRQALPAPQTLERTRHALEANRWSSDRDWGHYPTPHFHTTTHECYAVFRGTGSFCLGSSLDDDQHLGRILKLNKGDVLVVPVSDVLPEKNIELSWKFPCVRQA